MRRMYPAMVVLLMITVTFLGCSDDKGTNVDQGPLVLSLTPNSVETSVGQGFEIAIQTVNVSNLFGLSCEVEYDSTKMEAVDVVAGDFLGENILFFGKVESGTVSVAVTKTRGTGAVSGSGRLARIAFQSLATGQSEVAFNRTTLTLRKEDGSDVSGFSGIVLEESSVNIE